MGAASARPEAVRVLRVIARLNMGGPAHHVGLLSSRLDPERYETLLLHGDVGAGRGLAGGLACGPAGARWRGCPGCGPSSRPARRRAGARGRSCARSGRLRPTSSTRTRRRRACSAALAAVLAGGPRPADRPHLPRPRARGLLRARARTPSTAAWSAGSAGVSDALIGVSQATVDDLVRLGVAPREQFRVIPIGLDLEPFLERDAGRRRARSAREAGVQDGRGAADLRRAARADQARRRAAARVRARARARARPVRLALVGDGELRPELERLAADLGVSRTASGSPATARTWCPWRRPRTSRCSARTTRARRSR